MRATTLRIVSINDVYSLENLPRMATCVRHHRDDAPADAFFSVLAGDFLAPSLLSSLDEGVGMVECLNAIPITHVCFGNHEQDVSFEALQRRVAEFRGTWLNTNMPAFRPKLPCTQVIRVHHPDGREVKVGLLAVVTEDPTLYQPTPFGGHRILPANETALRVARSLVADCGCACVIALTHQSLDRDRALAQSPAAHSIALILGGHEHEPHLEQPRADGPWLVKAGSEATHAAVIDLTWPETPPTDGAPDRPRVSVRLEPLASYPESPALRTMVDGHMRAVRALHATTLLRLPDGVELTSVGTRMQQTSLGQMLATRVRDALRVDACMLNGGGIRANTRYRERFTYGDLESELPFENEVVVVTMPGAVLRDAIAASRAHCPMPAAGFLQVDAGVRVDAAHRVTAVGGAAFDPTREYRVATVRVLFDGMDDIGPLLRFAREQPARVPPRDSGRELKIILVEAFAMELWRSIGPFEAIDANHDLSLSADELRAAVSARTHEPAASVLIDGILRMIDANHDGVISQAEALAAEAGQRPPRA